MIKVPKFVTEYAKYETKKYEQNEIIGYVYKYSAINTINRAVESYKHGLITLSECMTIIANPFKYM